MGSDRLLFPLRSRVFSDLEGSAKRHESVVPFNGDLEVFCAGWKLKKIQMANINVARNNET